MHVVTNSDGASSFEQCVCDIEYFDIAASQDERSCELCDSNTVVCDRRGLTLANLFLKPSHWRLTNRTADIHSCDSTSNSTPCLGGDVSGKDGTGYCADGHEGPLCKWCSNTSLYYDASSASCKECGNVAEYAPKQIAVALAIIVVLALLRLVVVRVPQLLSQVSSKLAQLSIALQQFGLKAKFKSCLFFFQVWSVRESVYGFSLPRKFSGWLSAFEALNFDVGGFIFPSWTCAGSLTTRLALGRVRLGVVTTVRSQRPGPLPTLVNQ